MKSDHLHAIVEDQTLMLINGHWVPSSTQETLPVYNPGNGKLLTKIPLANAEDVDKAVQSARLAFETQLKSKITPLERGEMLWKLADLLERDKKILMQLESLDNGKPINKAEYDVDAAIKHFRYFSGWTTKILGHQIPVSSPDKLVYTRKEALGVVGLITPWNFPLMMAAWKVAPALACGNACILKPAEQTSLTALHLGKLALEAGFPKGALNVVTGNGAVTGEAISTHMDIDKVGFTGSTLIGKRIMAAAAKSNLKKVSLELGGKSPNIIFNDADLKKVKESIVWSSFYNTGQECTLGSRIYVQEEIFEDVLHHLIIEAEKLTIGEGKDNPDLGPMISELQMNSVLEYIELGKKEAELVHGGHRIEGKLANGYFISPTIFVTKNDDIRIVQEEIFGPVVTISPFKDESEITARANDSIYGLASAIWTNDISKAHRLASKINAGTIWINGYDMFDPSVPFGGYKQSGFGREMGASAIDLYTQEKSVWVAL